MEHDSEMSPTINSKIIGSCTHSTEHNVIVWFKGWPTDYGVILCEKCSRQSPFDKNILRVTPLGKA